MKKPLTPYSRGSLFSKMKLLSILVASIWVVAAAAQGITIGFPPEGKDVSPGQQLTIEVIKNVGGPSYFPSENILTSVLDPGIHSINNRGRIGHWDHPMPSGHFSFRLFARWTGYHFVQWSFQSPVKWTIFLREFHGDNSVWYISGWCADSFRSLFFVRRESSLLHMIFFKEQDTHHDAIFFSLGITLILDKPMWQ